MPRLMPAIFISGPGTNGNLEEVIPVAEFERPKVTGHLNHSTSVFWYSISRDGRSEPQRAIDGRTSQTASGYKMLATDSAC
jgi:hypothetical protein